MRQMRQWETDAGSGCARHVVQLGAMAALDSGLARRHRRSANVLSDQFADQRIRHSFLLGRADGDARPASGATHENRRANSLSATLFTWDCSRSSWNKDVENARERNRSTGNYREIR